MSGFKLETNPDFNPQNLTDSRLNLKLRVTEVDTPHYGRWQTTFLTSKSKLTKRRQTVPSDPIIYI